MFREQCVKFAEMDTREQLHEAFFCQPGLRNFESVGPLELTRLSRFMVHYLNQRCRCYSLPAVSRRSDDFIFFFFKSSAEQITFEVTQ